MSHPEIPAPQTWAWSDPEPEPAPGWEFITTTELGTGERTRHYTLPALRYTEPAPLVCGGGSVAFATGGFIPGPSRGTPHWRGYTAKVGLRKPGTLAWARAQLNDPHLTTDEWDEFIEYQSSHLTPAQVDAFAPWFADMRRPLKIHDPGVHKPFNDDGADPHWSDEDRIALGVECLLCHNAAAGHDRTVPPDHDCGKWERIIECAECDGLTPTEQEPGTAWHLGRSWSGHPLEDECPCPQELCGLISAPVSECDQHNLRTIRQGHAAEQCPAGLTPTEQEADRNAEEARREASLIAAQRRVASIRERWEALEPRLEHLRGVRDLHQKLWHRPETEEK